MTRAASASLPPLTEKDFLRQVVQLAEIRGWQWLHLRPGMTRDSWRTPISGPLGKGWPDLVLTRKPKTRDALSLIFAELKRDGVLPSQEQSAVLHELAMAAGIPDRWAVYIWRPEDWPEIERALA